jgi:catechol 2,3-dioxygenase-like lactoylglutathione lyase family enzyme
MTALTKYQRLECSGLWRAAPEDRRREVIVAFRKASLVISDSRSGVALAHWSLPAIERIGAADGAPALFAPGRDAHETLEIDDETMIGAIETVRRVIASRRRGAGRARRLIPVAIALAAVLAGAIWLPGALIRHTASVLPAAKRAEIAAAVLADIATTHRPCAAPLGRRALNRLTARVLGPSGRALILSGGPEPAAHLPDGRILLSYALIENSDGPGAAAGYMLAERLAAEAGDPVLPALRHAGFVASFRLLTTGDLPEGALAGYGARLFERGPAQPADGNLLARMEAAGVPAAPYAYARDPSGETTLALIEADPFRDAAAPMLLSDGDWVSLQGICDA